MTRLLDLWRAGSSLGRHSLIRLLLAVAFFGVLTSCSISVNSSESVTGEPLPPKPSVQVDNGSEGSPFLTVEGRPARGSRSSLTEVRGWGNRNGMAGLTFDKFEVRADNGDATMLAFFSLCHPLESCRGSDGPSPNWCRETSQVDRVSCHVESSSGRAYELSLLDNESSLLESTVTVTVAEAQAAADIADSLAACPPPQRPLDQTISC